MLEVEKVIFTSKGRKVCWLCGNHYDGDTESCPDCDRFYDTYVFSPGKVNIFGINGNVFRDYYESNRVEVLNFLKQL